MREILWQMTRKAISSFVLILLFPDFSNQNYLRKSFFLFFSRQNLSSVSQRNNNNKEERGQRYDCRGRHPVYQVCLTPTTDVRTYIRINHDTCIRIITQFVVRYWHKGQNNLAGTSSNLARAQPDIQRARESIFANIMEFLVVRHRVECRATVTVVVVALGGGGGGGGARPNSYVSAHSLCRVYISRCERCPVNCVRRSGWDLTDCVSRDAGGG